MIVIILNVVLLAMPYLGNSLEYTQVIGRIGYVFAAIYNIEAIIKIGGLRARYFEDNWNRMDFFIVITNDIGMIFEKCLFSPNNFFIPYQPNLRKMQKMLSTQ